MNQEEKEVIYKAFDIQNAKIEKLEWLIKAIQEIVKKDIERSEYILTLIEHAKK